MPECRTVSEINDYITLFVARVIQDIADEVREDVYRDVRSQYNHSIMMQNRKSNDYYRYNHTFDVLESICQPKVIMSKGMLEVEIYYDPDKIKPLNTGEESMWNSHMDVNGNDTWNGMSIPELIPIWMELGTTNGLAPRDGWGIMEAWHNNLKATLKSRVKSELKSRYGLKVK